MGKLRGGMRMAAQWLRARLGAAPGVHYVAPESNWIIDWVGHYVTSQVRGQFGLDARLATDVRWLAGQIIHYGTLWSWLGNLGTPQNRRNQVVATVFHGDRQDADFSEALNKLVDNQASIQRLLTASTIMEQRFIEWGITPERIANIPLGIDLDLFSQPTPEQRRAKRAELGIPEDAFCIGSFHKDGVGWDEGLEPKLIKGPDVFLKVIDRLSQSYKIHVLLSAPARGYVKEGLDALAVPYTHRVFDDYLQIGGYYHALDAYLIASREEGGPSGVLEAMASGVPLVSTRVGLTPDVAREGLDALICEVEDVDALAEALARIRDDGALRQALVAEALQRIQDFGWPQIAARYYHEVYAPLVRAN